MPANVYECLYLLDTNKVAGDVAKAADHLKAILEKHGVEVLASRVWDERRLAYPIRNHKKGLYYLMYFRSEGKNLVNIEKDFALSEVLLRYMILRIDPKLVDTMLALAKDEHALALQIAPEPSGEGEESPAAGGEGDGRGPRRGGRRQLETAEAE